MSHVRTQIREAMKEALEAELGDGYVIYASRKFAKNLEALALIDMRFAGATVEQSTMGDVREHTASLMIRCQRGAPEETIDDLLDADELAINYIIENQDWDDLLMEQPVLTQVTWTDDASTGTVIGSIVLRYDVQYRVTTTDLETARD